MSEKYQHGKIKFLSPSKQPSNVEEKVVIHRGRCNDKVYYRLSHDVDNTILFSGVDGVLWLH